MTIGLGLAGLTGCASYFKRKQCEALNIYQYGYDLAMKGQRISNDTLIMECRKAEAEISETDLDNGFKAGMSNYCKPESVFQTGKSGERLNLDLCDPGQSRLLRARHAEGVKAFCTPTSGYEVGASGRTYNKICPDDLEAKFLPEYQRGRKKYLAAMVSETQGKVADLNRRVSERERERMIAQAQLMATPAPRKVIQRTTTPAGIVEEEKISDPYAANREQFQGNLNRAEASLRELQSQQKSLQDELYKYQRELQTLD